MGHICLHGPLVHALCQWRQVESAAREGPPLVLSQPFRPFLRSLSFSEDMARSMGKLWVSKGKFLAISINSDFIF